MKTRLLAVTSPEQAAAIAVELLRRTLDTARRSSVRDIELWCTPTTRHSTLVELGEDFSMALQTQTGADLGERMFSAVEQSLDNYRHVMLAGSDCIDLAVADLDLAREKLAEGYDYCPRPVPGRRLSPDRVEQVIPGIVYGYRMGGQTVLCRTPGSVLRSWT